MDVRVVLDPHDGSPERSTFVAVATLALLSALSVAFADVPLARWVSTLPAGVSDLFAAGTDGLDVLSGKALADSALGLTLIGAALVVRMRPSWRPLAKLLVLVALSNLLTHLAVGVLKPVFGRLRPFEIAEAGWDDRFFAGGSSFPSGHTAFYWGIALPLFRALPRWRFVALLPASFIGVARVLVNHHFAGDVLAAMTVAFAVSGGLSALFERRAGRAPDRGRTDVSQADPGSGE